MRVAVTGSSGFIGQRFCEMYSSDSSISELRPLVRGEPDSPLFYDLTNYDSLFKAFSEVDVVIHCAFDHSYKSNRLGMKNVLRACDEAGVSRLVFLSSVSVYDPSTTGVLNEGSSYSSFMDPYSREKIYLEKLIRESKSTVEVVILQPTIVYGLGGNWTQYALNACMNSVICLPESGNKPCNVVYVDDVCNAIYQSVFSKLNSRVETFLVGGEVITWKEFYTNHCYQLFEDKGVVTSFSEASKKYHENVVLNFLFYLWLETFLGLFLNLVVGVLKSLRSKSYKKLKSKNDLHGYDFHLKESQTFSPSGVSRLVHSALFKVNYEKAQVELGYKPAFSFKTNKFLESCSE